MCTEGTTPDTLTAFLYGELPAADARAFETHMRACEPCRAEVAALRAVRDDLLAWAPPECRELPSSWASAPAPPPAPMARMRAWVPAFGLAAAAMLLLAISASIANLEIRYDAQGLVVRTGRGAAAPGVDAGEPGETGRTLAGGPAAAAPHAASAGVTRDDLAALERRVLETFAAGGTRAGMQSVALGSDNPQLSREVRRLIEESERRTRQEMADRFLTIVADFEGHRRADMLRVSQAIGQMQSRTGAELAQTRDALGRLLLVSQGQPPQR